MSLILTATEIALLTLVAWLSYSYVATFLFHPLKSIPGPRLAAWTNLYAGYYEIWKGGLLVEHLEHLHRIYGPVVRIRPNEAHFSTSEAYFSIYPSPSGFMKDPSLYDNFTSSNASFGFIDARAHKERVELLGPLFSRRAILKFEQTIQDQVNLLIEQLQRYKPTEPINLHAGFRTLTMDIITKYCYGHSFGGITSPGFDHSIPDSADSSQIMILVSRYFPPFRLFQYLPPRMLKLFGNDVQGFAEMHNVLSGQIDAVLADPGALWKDEHETIYHHLLPNGEDSRRRWPSKESLIAEAQALLGAGLDTVANTASFGFYHILSRKDVKMALNAELARAWPEKDSPFTYEQAEKLPYLTAVLKESLRISIGVSAPLPRIVSSPAGAMIDGVPLPQGAGVSVSARFILKNPDIFPDPDQFKPERWLQPDSVKLEKYLVIFSKGPRSCLGINLAWCELYNIFAHLLRKFDLKLHDTRPEDMARRDYFVPVWVGKGIRVVVEERSD